MGQSKIEAKMCNRYQARRKRENYFIITLGFAVCSEVKREKDARRTRKQFLQSRSIENCGFRFSYSES